MIDTVVTGDARILIEDIPDESIDLILTDPIYSNLDDYSWLAEQAYAVLKPDSALLAWYGGAELPRIIKDMSTHLAWTWPLKYVVVAKSHRLIAYNIFTWTTLCLWFRKGKGFPHSRIPDTFISTSAPTGTHKWNKNFGVIRYWMEAFTCPGDTVLDPFIGSGTVGVVAKQTGRHFIGFEVDPATAATARTRIETSQPPLFIPATQPELF